MIHSKKAQEEISLKHIIHAFLAITVTIALAYYYINVVTGEATEKQVLAKNNALLIDILLASKSNIYVAGGDPLNYSYEFSENSVTVFSKLDIIKRHVYFAENPNIKVKPISFTPKKTIQFLKQGGELTIGENLSPSQLQQIECPAVAIQKIETAILVPDEDQEQAIVESIKTQLEPHLKEIDIKRIIDKEVDLIVKITYSQENQITAKILPESLESRRIACLIINGLKEKNPEQESRIIVSREYPLNEAEIAVSLEIDSALETADTSLQISDTIRSFS